MISKVTENNVELINARIEEINEALEATGSSTRISNLEEYYANIVEISQLSTNFHNAPYRFFLMPLDEPMFEIDANKRSITVPAVFNKNGVGVRGDHMAEVLYFKIDKYFDYQDLFTVGDIVINWQFRPSNASRNTELTTYTSYALAPDDTYDPGHIVFGWVIGNFVDKDGNQQFMTPGKGTLSFSVSFLKNEGSTYKYLFSTQTASVSINDTLILEDPSKLESVRRPVFERLTDSRFTPENIIPLKDPEFRSGDKDEDGKLLGLQRIANFEFNADNTEADTLTLSAIGRVSDDGSINYNWSGTKFASGDSVEGSGAAAYVKTVDAAPQDNITYYIFDEENGYTQLDEDTVQAAFDDVNVEVYEAGSSFNVTESGDYMVTLQSVKTVGDNVAKSGNIESCTCSVPLAAVPAVALSVEGLAPGANNENYEIFDKDEASKWTFISDSAPEVTATISIDESKIWDEAEKTGIKGVMAGSELGMIALKMTNAEGDEGKPSLEEAAAISADNFVRYDGQPIVVNSDSANGEGTYKVYAINKRNHTYNVSDASNELHVSLPAPLLSQIDVELVQEDENLLLIDDNARTENASIEIFANDASRDFIITINDDLSHAEALDVKVFEIYANDYELDPPVITYLKDRENNPDLPNYYEPTLVDGTNNKFAFTISRDPGYFVVEITTKYHGTQRVTVTAPFNIYSSSSFDS